MRRARFYLYPTCSPENLHSGFPSSVAPRDSKWSKPASGIKIVPIITSKQTFTPGDAMRDIYTHSIITSDFVLVMGDLVSNVRLDEVVRIHKERRKTNKDAIMTMVVKESGASHRTRYARTCLCNLLPSHLRGLCALKHVRGRARRGETPAASTVWLVFPSSIRHSSCSRVLNVLTVIVRRLVRPSCPVVDLDRKATQACSCLTHTPPSVSTMSPSSACRPPNMCEFRGRFSQSIQKYKFATTLLTV